MNNKNSLIKIEKSANYGGDLNLFFDLKLDTRGGNLALTNKSLAKLIKFKETYELCDAWRIRNLNFYTKTFFRFHPT